MLQTLLHGVFSDSVCMHLQAKAVDLNTVRKGMKPEYPDHYRTVGALEYAMMGVLHTHAYRKNASSRRI